MLDVKSEEKFGAKTNAKMDIKMTQN